MSRRFFLVVPYMKPAGVQTIDFTDVQKQLSEKKSNITDIQYFGERLLSMAVILSDLEKDGDDK